MWWLRHGFRLFNVCYRIWAMRKHDIHDRYFLIYLSLRESSWCRSWMLDAYEENGEWFMGRSLDWCLRHCWQRQTCDLWWWFRRGWRLICCLRREFDLIHSWTALSWWWMAREENLHCQQRFIQICSILLYLQRSKLSQGLSRISCSIVLINNLY